MSSSRLCNMRLRRFMAHLPRAKHRNHPRRGDRDALGLSLVDILPETRSLLVECQGEGVFVAQRTPSRSRGRRGTPGVTRDRISLPERDAWYFGAAMVALVGKKDGAIRLLDAEARHSFLRL